jgi:hypothetical protein
MSLGIVLDPVQQTGLTVVAKVRDQSGAQIGSAASLTEGDPGVYVGAFSLVAVTDGVYSVTFLDNTTGWALGHGELVVKANAEVDRSNLALASAVALIETKVQADARQAILVAEHDATQAAIAGLNNASASAIANSVWASVSRTLTDKANFTLSSAYQATLVTAVEAALLNDGDGQALINAILTVINNNLDLPALELQAIATQVRIELATELARIDASISSRASQVSLDNTDGVVDNIYTNTQRVNALIENVSGDRFTAKALEQASTSESDIHTALDSYANKAAWKADVSGLATQLSIDNLNNLSIADIDARLIAYGAPTLAEMTSAFTEIKGTGWTVADTLEAISGSIALVGTSSLTAFDVWNYINRSLTEDVTMDLTSVLMAISSLNNLSTADIDARLTAYGAPTLAELNQAFTEIKGGAWTNTDTLTAIKTAISTGTLTPEQVWGYDTTNLPDAIRTKTGNILTKIQKIVKAIQGDL